jgi:hypothetical protein
VIVYDVTTDRKAVVSEGTAVEATVARGAL